MVDLESSLHPYGTLSVVVPGDDAFALTTLSISTGIRSNPSLFNDLVFKVVLAGCGRMSCPWLVAVCYRLRLTVVTGSPKQSSLADWKVSSSRVSIVHEDHEFRVPSCHQAI